jgi:hypothetical protein
MWFAKSSTHDMTWHINPNSVMLSVKRNQPDLEKMQEKFGQNPADEEWIEDHDSSLTSHHHGKF